MKTLLEKTEIYYHGDMANNSDFGIIENVTNDKWGIRYDILLDDGRKIKGIPEIMFSEEYRGNGLTRFVTKEAYNKYREEILEIIHKRVTKESEESHEKD